MGLSSTSPDRKAAMTVVLARAAVATAWVTTTEVVEMEAEKVQEVENVVGIDSFAFGFVDESLKAI